MDTRRIATLAGWLRGYLRWVDTSTVLVEGQGSASQAPGVLLANDTQETAVIPLTGIEFRARP